MALLTLKQENRHISATALHAARCRTCHIDMVTLRQPANCTVQRRRRRIHNGNIGTASHFTHIQIQRTDPERSRFGMRDDASTNTSVQRCRRYRFGYTSIMSYVNTDSYLDSRFRYSNMCRWSQILIGFVTDMSRQSQRQINAVHCLLFFVFISHQTLTSPFISLKQQQISKWRTIS